MYSWVLHRLHIEGELYCSSRRLYCRGRAGRSVAGSLACIAAGAAVESFVALKVSQRRD